MFTARSVRIDFGREEGSGDGLGVETISPGILLMLWKVCMWEDKDDKELVLIFSLHEPKPC